MQTTAATRNGAGTTISGTGPLAIMASPPAEPERTNQANRQRPLRRTPIHRAASDAVMKNVIGMSAWARRADVEELDHRGQDRHAQQARQPVLLAPQKQQEDEDRAERR